VKELVNEEVADRRRKRGRRNKRDGDQGHAHTFICIS
jgi:hypothetical protein